MKAERKEKRISVKDGIVAVLGIMGVLYMLNLSFGVLEILPDNLPLIGNMDEAAALFLVYSAMEYFGWNVKSLFTREKE